jgi:hypothetical protein
MIEKVCTKCGLKKDISLFVTKSKSPDGHSSECKDCHNSHNRKKYWENSDENRRKNLINVKRSYLKNRDTILLRAKKYRENNLNKEAKKLYMKEYRVKKKKEIRQTQIVYEQTHKDKKKEWDRNYRRRHREELNVKNVIKRNSCPENKLRHNLRNRIRLVLKGIKRGGNLYCLVGCTADFLKEYLANQFTEGMSWDNYGMGEGKWSEDHIIPLVTFNLEDIEEQKKAFHYTNMRPCWSLENSSKGSLHNGVRHRKKAV